MRPDSTAEKVHEIVGLTRLPGWRRVLPFALEQTESGSRIRILWLELGLCSLGALVCGYVALSCSVWLYLKERHDLSEISCLDTLLPGRWDRVRVAIGGHYIALAQQQLAAGESREALFNLRVGVAKAPRHVAGRLQLAQLYAAARRPDLAQQILLAGLPVASRDPAFLQALFGFLLQRQEDALVLATSRDLLADPASPDDCRRIAALAAASAAYFRGNYDQAEDLLVRHRLQHTRDGRLLSAQFEWERGYRDLAVVQLRTLLEEFPADEPIRSQLASWLRAQGLNDELRRLNLLRRLATPRDPGPRLELLRTLRDQGDRAALARETGIIFAESAGDEKALRALADFAAATGDAALARRVYEHCHARNFAWEAPAFLAVETLVVTRDYRGALDLIARLLDENRDWARRYDALLNSLRAVAHCGLGDTASSQLYLANFLSQSDLRADNLLAVAQRFADLGATDQARETLTHAIAADPLNQAALTRLIQLDLELNRTDALPANLRRLLAMRRPSPEVLRAAYRKLGSDLFLFSRERDATLAAIQQTLAATPAPRPSS